MDMILTSLILWPVRRFAPAVAAIVGPKIVSIVATSAVVCGIPKPLIEILAGIVNWILGALEVGETD